MNTKTVQCVYMYSMTVVIIVIMEIAIIVAVKFFLLEGK